MRNHKKIKMIFTASLLATFWLTTANLFAQHRGDNLSFQGLTYKENFDAKSMAMGGALTAVAGNLSSLFYNTAGLARIDKFQISVSVNQYNRQWRENQNYYTDRQFTSLPFYLEGLYIPKIENNGKYDGDLYKDTANYLLRLPQMGLNEYDEAAAQWKNTKSEFGLRNITVAYPFYMGDRKFVAAASYSRNTITDFDRNDTYLSPMITSYDYETNFKRIVNGVDTLVMKWSRFLRQRYGTMNNYTAGLSNEIVENVMLGVGVKIQNGSSDDYLSLTRAGDFHLMNSQQFKFYFVNQAKIISGTSKFSSTGFNIGALVELNKIKLGLKVDLPYTLTRDWNYLTVEKGQVNSSQSTSGKDEFKMPAIYNFGFSFQPMDKFLISFNYEYAPYSKATVNFAAPDTTFRNWTDQNTLAFAIEYKMYNSISIMAGYRSIPQVFVPDGAAIKDRGPIATTYNFGLGIDTFLGRLDLAYEYRLMKYYDSYYSNANFNFESNSTFMVGLTYSF